MEHDVERLPAATGKRGGAQGSVVAVALIALIALGSPAAALARGHLLVPAYFGPGPSWTEATGAGSGTVLVMNPDSGPGTRADAGYRGIVRAVRRAHARLVGYVPTGYGRRPLRAIERDLDRYRRWYGLRDVFFDETASQAGALGGYRRAVRYARDHGGHLIVLNCGVVPARGYFDIADIVVTFEDTYARYVHARFPSWLRRYPRSRQAHIIIAADSAPAGRHALALAKQRGAGFAYVTDRGLPNPYGALPRYFRREQSWISG